jgi:hypothetical protein
MRIDNNLFSLLSVVCLSSTDAYLPTSIQQRSVSGGWTSFQNKQQQSNTVVLFSSTSARSDADFSAFADSLADDDDEVGASEGDAASASKSSTTSTTSTDSKPWQMKLEELLDPKASVAERQVLLSELLNANEKIRDSVIDALTNRKVRLKKCF